MVLIKSIFYNLYVKVDFFSGRWVDSSPPPPDLIGDIVEFFLLLSQNNVDALLSFLQLVREYASVYYVMLYIPLLESN